MASALIRVWIALETVELVQKLADHQQELLAHLEQKLAHFVRRFQVDLPLDFDLQRECYQKPELSH